MMRKKIIEILSTVQTKLLIYSLRQALKQQNLTTMYKTLLCTGVDITNQYPEYELTSEYHQLNVRALHSFQVALIRKAINGALAYHNPLTVIDIGDPVGNHLEYLYRFYPGKIKGASVDINPHVVRRMNEQDKLAYCIDAENIEELGIKCDMAQCFEMLEHLKNPYKFLEGVHSIGAKVLVITVPYVRHSRISPYSNIDHETGVGHIFELSPHDWKMLFTFNGWRVEYEAIFMQYPKWHILTPLLRWWWRKHDFEGFYGVILKRNGDEN